MYVAGTILRLVRGCTNSQRHDGEKCITSEGAASPAVDQSSSDGRGPLQQRRQQPAKQCVWTCNTDGCNSGNALRQHRRQLLQSLSASLVIIIIATTLLTTDISDL